VAAARPSSLLPYLTLPLFCALSVSCGSTEGKNNELAEAPSEGTILYSEPVPPTGMARKDLRPISQAVTTGDDELAEDDSVQTLSGVVGLPDQRGSPDGRESASLVRRLFGSARLTNVRVLSREKFAALWGRLRDAGLFDLPRYRGKEAPRDEPYFMIQTGLEKLFYQRPALAAHDPDDPSVEWIVKWRQAKIEFFNFLNEP
jgi:hypothetical protein